MGLVLGVVGRHREGVVGELGRKLDARPAEAAGHDGVHVRTRDVGRVEFVDQPSLVRALRKCVERGRVPVHVREHVSAQRSSAHQGGRVPLHRDALDAGSAHGAAVGIGVPFGYVVENGFLPPGGPRGGHEPVDVGGRDLGVARMVRFVDELHGDHGRVVLVGLAGVRIHVPHPLVEVAHLGGDRNRVGAELGFREWVDERAGVGRGLGITRRPPGDGREHRPDAPLGEASHEVVVQIETVVRDQISDRIGNFTLPDVHAEGVEPQPGDMRDVGVDGGLMIDAELPVRPVAVREGGRIVYAEERDLGFRIGPAHHAVPIDKDGILGRSAVGAGGAERGDEQNRNEAAGRHAGRHRTHGFEYLPCRQTTPPAPSETEEPSRSGRRADRNRRPCLPTTTSAGTAARPSKYVIR